MLANEFSGRGEGEGGEGGGGEGVRGEGEMEGGVVISVCWMSLLCDYRSIVGYG